MINDTGSPIRHIASPKMMRGLSITKKARNQLSERGSSPQTCGTPDIRIRNYKNDINSRRQSVSSANNQMTSFGSAGQPSKQSLISKHKESVQHKPNGAFADVFQDFQNMSLNQGNFLNGDGIGLNGNLPQSPKKMNRRNKFIKKFEESKSGSLQMSNATNEDLQELQRNFSPINMQKTQSIRIKFANMKAASGATNDSGNF